MVSSDIQSFIKIPLDETISICVENVLNNRKIKGLLKKDFRKLLTLSVNRGAFYSVFITNKLMV